jgi:hypothetical protein
MSRRLTPKEKTKREATRQKERELKWRHKHGADIADKFDDIVRDFAFLMRMRSYRDIFPPHLMKLKRSIFRIDRAMRAYRIAERKRL